MPTQKNNAQKGRFVIVGATSTAIDFGLLFVFRYLLHLPVIPANIGSTGIAFVFSFFANRKFTFRSTSQRIVRQMALFTVVTLFGLWVLQSLVIELLLPGLRDLLGSQPVALLVAKLIATGVTMVWNYLLYSRLVFKESD